MDGLPEVSATKETITATITEVPADTTHTLRVDMHPHECPVDADGFVLTPEFPTAPVRNRACEQGSFVEFEYHSGRPDTPTRVRQATGRVEPRFAENLWGHDAKLEAAVETDWEIPPPPPPTTTTTVPPPPSVPTLECSDDGPQLDGEWDEDQFSGRIVAAECGVNLPADGAPTAGTGSLEVASLSGDLDYHLETPDGTRLTGQLSSGDLPREFRVVSEPLDAQGPWDLVGEIEVILPWMLAGKPPETPQTAHIPVPPTDFDSGWHPLVDYPDPPTLECSDSAVTLINANNGEVPTEPLRAEAACTATGPGMGVLLLSMDWSSDPADDSAGAYLPEAIDWFFETEPGRAGNARSLEVRAGDTLARLPFATAETLDNTRTKGTGIMTVEAVWVLDWQEQRLVALQDLPVEIDLRARSNPLLAALLALIAALLTYTLLYAIMARSSRLPPAGRFYAGRLEFRTEPNPSGLLSAQLDDYLPEKTDWNPVRGDRQKLRVFDLTLNAEHPRWWHIASILNSGWGRPSLGGDRHVVSTAPAGPPSKPGTTAEQFSELAVIALETGGTGPSDAPRGVAFLLVPKRSADRRLEGRNLTDLLRSMTQRYADAASRTARTFPGDTAAGHGETPRADDSPPGGPPSGPPDAGPPPRKSGPPPRPRPEPGGGSTSPPPPEREPPPRRPR